jgi:hypothetical protein
VLFCWRITNTYPIIIFQPKIALKKPYFLMSLKQYMTLQILQPFYSGVMKKSINKPNTLKYFCNLANEEEWQRKLAEDQHFIRDLLSLPEGDHLWDLFSRIAQHSGILFI